METVSIKNWADLCELCNKFAIGDWIFRGVPNLDYLPQPAIGRKGARVSLAGRTLPFDATEAKKLLRQFKRRARPFVTLPESADDLEWLALARHHNMPTQLLDWTTSPLIAAYFACWGGGVHEGKQTTAAIFAVRMSKQVESLADALNATEPVAYFPYHISPRIAAQHGLFTFHQDPSQTWVPPKLIRYEIASEVAIVIKIALWKAGIGPAIVMPGLDGLGEDLGWQYKREFLERIHQSESSENSGTSFEGFTDTVSRLYVTRVTERINLTESADGSVEKSAGNS